MEYLRSRGRAVISKNDLLKFSKSVLYCCHVISFSVVNVVCVGTYAVEWRILN